MLNYAEIFRLLNESEARWLLAGGLNFSLRHHDYLTQDVDILADSAAANLTAVNTALHHLGATWGATVEEWGPVPNDATWLAIRPVVCVNTRFGFLDIFTQLAGLDRPFAALWERAIPMEAGQIPFRALSDGDMLACQLALPEADRKLDRIRVLEKALGLRK